MTTLMSELDKFKRRLIRSVARRILQNSQPESEVWDQLRKETGCDCQLLWKRMRALTIKKLKRLLAAEDKLDNVAAVARLSTNDWLLFDLVLVHEKIDVIDKDNMTRKEENPVLRELFGLAKHFQVEWLSGDELVNAWMHLTRAYNAKGRQVSAMLLQRRWYQLKELTRNMFYQLWFTYRGNNRLWETARDRAQPTKLQADIAKEFPRLITTDFQEWEELIQQKRVILSFEDYQIRGIERTEEPPQSEDTTDKPDIEMIEPVIETIDLGAESDDEVEPPTNANADRTSARKSEAHKSNLEQEDTNLGKDEEVQFNLASVKQEPIDDEPDGLTNVLILEATHVPEEDTTDAKKQRNKQLSIELEEIKQHISSLTDDNEIEADKTQALNENNEIDDGPDVTPVTPESEIPDDLIKQKADEFIKSKKRTSQPKSVTKDDSEDEVAIDKSFEDIIKKKADEFVRKVDLKKLASGVVGDLNIPEEVKAEIVDAKVEKQIDSAEISGSFDDDCIDGGIEFVDDGIEEDEDDIIQFDMQHAPSTFLPTDCNTQVKPIEDNEDIIKEEPAETSKFDLKLLMTPVVCTVKLDKMNTFKDRSFIAVTEGEVITKALKESLPVKKSVKIKLDEESIEEKPPEIKKGTVDTIDINTEESKETVNLEPETTTKIEINIEEEIKPEYDAAENSEFLPDNDCDSNQSFEVPLEIAESLKVKSTSILLQKPRHRTYNFIQVCKNPDFNTRLKRLTTGFFCSPRNRQLLNACKPLTIDLNKAFESRLINGTLYLKSGGEAPKPLAKEEVPNNTVQTPSVVPSAMPLQSLLKAEVTSNIEELVPVPAPSAVDLGIVDLTARVYTRRPGRPPGRPNRPPDNPFDAAARNKVINLRDLSEIRRINQNLLTAQVPPIRVERNAESGSNLEQLQTALLQDIGEIQPRPGPAATQQPEQPEHRPTILEDGLKDKEKIEKLGTWKNTRMEMDAARFAHIPRKVQPKPKFAQLPNRKVAVPWRPKLQNTQNIDSCITFDTLNRMINKLDGWDQPSKKMKVAHPRAPDTPPPRLRDPAAEVEKLLAFPDPGETTPAEVPTQVKPKPKPKSKQAPAPYCCWARLKAVNLPRSKQTTRRHLCVGVCSCCCRAALLPVLRRHPAARAALVRTNDPMLQLLLQADRQRSDASTDTRDAPDTAVADSGVTIDLSDDDSQPPLPKIRVYSSDTARAKTTTNAEKVRVTSEPAAPVDDLRPVMRVNIQFTQQPEPAPEPEPAPAPPVPYIEAVSKAGVVAPVRQRSLVIDGSQPGRFFSIQNQNFVFMNSKSVTEQPKDCPIYLGKDKILLTTVKFPPHLLNEGSKPKETLKPTVVPSMGLPRGVQLVLLANGVLTCVIDPTVKLSSQERNALPEILAAVQKQIDEQNKNPPPLQPVPEEISSAIQNIPSSQETTQGVALVLNKSDTETSITANLILKSNAVESGTLNNSNSSDVITLEETNDIQNQVEQNSEKPSTSEVQSASEPADAGVENNNGATGGSRNLLSDLMEMSGISTEDASVPCATVPSATVQDIASEVASSTTPEAPILESESALEATELTPIISLAQLKYACHENGKFFKLDLVTGIIMPINVCIRKHLKKAGQTPQVKSVIDLTDDGDKADVVEVSPEGATQDTEKSALSTDGSVKPVKLIKVCPKSGARIVPSILRKRRQEPTATNPRELHNQPRSKHARKQPLLHKKINKIEAKIDLVDSDAPMEEEYLLDNSDSDESTPRIINKTAPEEDDSSDDEPLAQKFVRIKADANKQQVTATIEAESTEQEPTKEIPPSTSEEPPQEPTDTPDDKNAEDKYNSDMELEESPLLPYFADETDAQDDDCILGV